WHRACAPSPGRGFETKYLPPGSLRSPASPIKLALGRASAARGGGRRRKSLIAALFIATLIANPSASARADNYPSKTITVIVPASPGGVTDMLARMLARRFISDWGAQAIVEDKPGANNQVAAEYVARQPGDGYTLFIGPETTFIVNPALYPHLAYD